MNTTKRRLEMTRRGFLTRVGVFGAGLAAASRLPGLLPDLASAAEVGPVNWLGWSSYAIPEVMDGFKKTTGSAVNFIPFNDNSEAFTKLKIGGGDQYDLIMADAFWPVKYYEEKLTQVIDVNSIDSAKTLFPEFRNFPIWKAEGGFIAYPNAWAPFCLIYNKKYFSSPPTSWEILWDPKYKNRVSVRGGATYVLPLCALMLGYEPFDMTPPQIAQAKDLAIKLKRNIKTFPSISGETTRLLADETVWAGYDSQPGIVWRVKMAGGPPMGWTIPKEGTHGWVDGDMLAKGAAHKDAALKWINYRQNPENHALMISKAFSGPTNRAAIAILKKMGLGEAVEALGYENPEPVLKMKLQKPPTYLDQYNDAYNEVLAS